MKRQWSKAWRPTGIEVINSPDRTGPFYLQLNQDVRPSWVNHIRVYEESPEAPADARDVIADVLAIPRIEQVDPIIREYGLVGAWRPSTVIVCVQDLGSNRIVVDDTIAHAIWNLDLGIPVQPNSCLGLWLTTQTEERRRFYAVMTATELTDKELGLIPGDPRCRNDGSLDPNDAQLEARVRHLEAVVRRMQPAVEQVTAAQRATRGKTGNDR